MTLLTVVLGVAGLLVAVQLGVRWKARSMLGRPLPPLPGPLGARVAASPRALLYFFSPSCGACKPLTPRFRELGRHQPGIFLVDVLEETALARALGVMGTPSVVEVAAGRIAGYHVGGATRAVLDRLAAPGLRESP
jgi:thioredoxin 1